MPVLEALRQACTANVDVVTHERNMAPISHRVYSVGRILRPFRMRTFQAVRDVPFLRNKLIRKLPA
jgi:hypothetical protein